jgi:predicted DNA-binding transcriptional regulator YafY
MYLKRICRILNLIGLLQGGREHNAESLGRELGASRRTVFRDLDLLKLAGVPLAFNPERQRYSIPGTYYLPPTNFTASEALSLIVLCHELGDQTRLPFFSAARSAAVKLESALPSHLREQLRRVSGAVHIVTAPRNPLKQHQTTYEQLLAAIGRQRSVRIQYRSLAEKSTIMTKLSPYELLFSRRSWYVIGRSSVHRGVRTFNVARILRLEPLEDRYRIPASFSLDRYLGNAWHLIREPGPDREVLIRFSPQVAQNVAEVQWHKTQRCVFNSDGSLNFLVTVSGVNEISWWILGYGDQAEVVRPAELRRMIAGRAARMAARYGEGPSPAADKHLQ